MSKKSKYDQYYTESETALRLFNIIIQICTETKFFLEPSAGKGVFSSLLMDKYGKDRVFAYDIEPKANHILSENFLDHNLLCSESTVTTILCPPFGYHNVLAITFFNKCATVSKYIAAIFPRSANKHSFQSKLNPYFHIIYNENLSYNSFVLNEDLYNVDCCFQIWERLEYKRRTDKMRSKVTTISPHFAFVNKDQKSDVAIIVSGTKAGKVISCKKATNYSEDSVYYIKIYDELLKKKNIYKLNLVEEANNTVGQNSVSKPEIVYAINLLIIELLSSQITK